ncbi:maleylacetoacetate isomerase [Rhizobium sp. G187]|uniref:maleylacetoacetate isomerase n=1 Tax=Rhizobium sp. G187 TaxID=3451352 RepID=UPI003EE55478
MNRPVLHNYFRSSTSYRVRIALTMKGIDYDYDAFHLRRGEQRSERFLSLNPQGLVPALTWSDGHVYTQSLSIIEFLDELVPEPPLLPKDPVERQRVRSLSQIVAVDIHPINNLRVLAYLKDHFSADETAQAEWFRHWVAEAFNALEQRLSGEAETGRYCHGDTVTMADLCLAAQLTNNKRFGVDMQPYPTIRRIGAALDEVEAFRRAAPINQPDNE